MEHNLFSPLSDLVLARSSAAKEFIHATIGLGDQWYTSATSPIEAHVAFTLPLPPPRLQDVALRPFLFGYISHANCRTSKALSGTYLWPFRHLYDRILGVCAILKTISNPTPQTTCTSVNALREIKCRFVVMGYLFRSALIVSCNCIFSWYIMGSARGQLRRAHAQTCTRVLYACTCA